MDKEMKWSLLGHLKQGWERARGYNSLVSIIITKETKLPLRGQLHRTLGTLLSPFKGFVRLRQWVIWIWVYIWSWCVTWPWKTWSSLNTKVGGEDHNIYDFMKKVTLIALMTVLLHKNLTNFFTQESFGRSLFFPSTKISLFYTPRPV